MALTPDDIAVDRAAFDETLADLHAAVLAALPVDPRLMRRIELAMENAKGTLFEARVTGPCSIELAPLPEMFALLGTFRALRRA